MTTPLRHRLRAAFALLALVLVGVLWAPTQAQAAGGNYYESFEATYTINADGTVDVHEKTVVNFVGSSSHGITRGLTVREPWQPPGSKDEGKDRVYEVSGIRVSSDKASAKHKVEDVPGTDKRYAEKLIRVGDPNSYAPKGLVTYTIDYRLTGALMTEGKGHNFYWDAIPSGAPLIKQTTISVVIPSGEPFDLQCAKGQGSSQGCSSTVSGTTARFTGTDMGDGNVMTIALYAPPGTISNAEPMLVDSVATQQSRMGLIGLAGTAVTSVLAGLGFFRWKAKHGRDERFIGLPPGIVPASNEQATVGLDTNPTIPVAFSPPRGMTPGEAGKVMDGAADIRDTTATLVDLAVRGAVKIYADDDQNMRVVLVNPNVATKAHEHALLAQIFAGIPVGTEVDLTTQGSMLEAHEDCSSALHDMVESYGWFKKMPTITQAKADAKPGMGNASAITGGVIGTLVLGGGAFIAGIAVSPWLMLAIPLVPFIVFGGMKLAVSSKGQRSATGRAYADQVLGFREYIATAEADQLRFEEGEDIFSKYLPWAISFDLTERWTQLCSQLVAMGRLQNAQPDWYYGPWSYGYFPGHVFEDTMTTSAMPEPSESGSGGFSSGGFSGGGGGGGGSMGTW